MIPVFSPSIKSYSSSAVKAISDGWISNHGEFVERASRLLEKVSGVKHAVLMSNGTAAVHCMVLALKKIHPKVAKIYISNSCFIAPWNCALMEYGIECLEALKVDPETGNMDVSEEYLKTLDANAAVIVVHNIGNIVNVPRLNRIRPDLVILEDNCEGFLGSYEGTPSGSSPASLCSALSFYGNKLITTGEGGAFLTNSTEVYDYIMCVHSHGMDPRRRYVHTRLAYNYRMTNVEAAFLYDQLMDYQRILESRKRLFERYRRAFSGIGGVVFTKSEEHTEAAPWMFSVRIRGLKCTPERTAEVFGAMGIETRPFFYPINTHEHLRSVKISAHETNVPELLNAEIVILPSSTTLVDDEIERVVSAVAHVVATQEDAMA